MWRISSLIKEAQGTHLPVPMWGIEQVLPMNRGVCFQQTPIIRYLYLRLPSIPLELWGNTLIPLISHPVYVYCDSSRGANPRVSIPFLLETSLTSHPLFYKVDLTVPVAMWSWQAAVCYTSWYLSGCTFQSTASVPYPSLFLICWAACQIPLVENQLTGACECIQLSHATQFHFWYFFLSSFFKVKQDEH